jgi:putative nucleotidyltransferase with HDIG domain
MTSYTEQALDTLHEWVQSEQLRKHCYAVAASMRHFARAQGADEDVWGAAGLLHDLDFERYPDMPAAGSEIAAISRALLDGGPAPEPLPGHPFYGVAYLRERGWPAEILRAILAHADYSGVPPETAMEKTLVAVDELSSFAIAVALVRPSRSIFDVDVAAVKKKMKDKAFARAVSREDIAHGAAELGQPLDQLIEQVLLGLRADAARLGVAGAPQPS